MLIKRASSSTILVVGTLLYRSRGRADCQVKSLSTAPIMALMEGLSEMPQTAGADRRTDLKKHYWPKDAAWNGAGSGWFKGPRTLPLILALLSQKELTGGRDISRVYLELLARHMDGGVIEIGNESDHAYASGYIGSRANRTWQERMQLLEHLGFIKSRQVGNQRYKLVLVVDPLVAVAELRKHGRVPDSWWEAYRLRLLETKEADEQRLERIAGNDTALNVGSLVRKRLGKKTRVSR